jgi:N-acetylmuramoyl-L-alanine amidase
MRSASDHPSPNCSPRRGGALPDMVVLHYTAMDGAASARARLCDAKAEVSAHYLIDLDGSVEALVPEELRAWHAGPGAWGQVRDVNSRSIGIELVNTGSHPFPQAQMSALELLLGDLMRRWCIAPERVIGHSDMAPGRKADPGRRFDWRRLALKGLSVWPAPEEDVATEGAGPEVTRAFVAAARAFGYPDLSPDTLCEAFRLRFRPWARGPLDGTDVTLAEDLAARFPVDARALQA